MLDSSQALASESQPSALEIPLIISKQSLYRKAEIIIGNIKRAIVIIATTPQELFIRSRLADMVFRESLTNPPTTGIKFPIAKRAVLSERESALWLRTL